MIQEFFFCSSSQTATKPMLPRHLRRSLLRPAARRPSLFSYNNFSHPPPFRIPLASFHSSRRSQNELPKSPFQTFVDVLKEELRKNRELQDNVKQLQGDVDKFQDSETMKRARAAYERARVRSIGLLNHWIIIITESIGIKADFQYKRESSVARCC